MYVVAVRLVCIMLPLRATRPCHLLPHVNGPTVSEYYEVI